MNPNAGKRRCARLANPPRLTDSSVTTGVTVIYADPGTIRRGLRAGSLEAVVKRANANQRREANGSRPAGSATVLARSVRLRRSLPTRTVDGYLAAAARAESRGDMVRAEKLFARALELAS